MDIVDYFDTLFLHSADECLATSLLFCVNYMHPGLTGHNNVARQVLEQFDHIVKRRVALPGHDMLYNSSLANVMHNEIDSLFSPLVCILLL